MNNMKVQSIKDLVIDENSLSQNEINCQSAPHYYRTETPNIVFDIGLSPYERTLYTEYKRIAGDQGACWKSNTELAKSCCMSLRKLIEVKKSLCLSRKELSGKPLIQVQQRVSSSGNQSSDMVFIVDIWRENELKMLKDKKLKEEKNTVVRPEPVMDEHALKKQERALGIDEHASERGVHENPAGVHDMHGGGARGADKEEPFKKNHKEERVSHPAERLACLLFDKIREHDPKHRIPNLKTWASDIEKLFRLDKRTEEEVESVICWVMKDDFWCKNILSGFKLRKKFDQLYLNKAKEKKSPQKLEEEKAKLKMQKRQKNKDWAEKAFKKKLESKEGSMEYLSNGVRVTYRNGWQIIPFTENGFKDQMKKYYMQIRG